MIKLPQTDAIALIQDSSQLTFNELNASILDIQNLLSSILEDTIAIRCHNDISTVILLLATLNSNKRLILLPKDITFIALKEKLIDLKSYFLYDEKISISNLDAYDLNNRTKLVLLTSGSKGKSKLVQLSEVNITSNTKAVINCLNFNQITNQYLFLPLSYSFGFLAQLIPALELGKTTFLFSSFTDFFKFSLSEEIEGMVSGTPYHHQGLLKLKHIKGFTHIVSAGGFLSPNLRKELHKSFPEAVIYNNYGQTEASPRILSYNSKSDDFFENYVGFPIGEWKLRLDKDSVLEVSGPGVMLGYIDSMAPKWLNTGDIAEITKDGLVKILGRSDDLIKLSGKRQSLFDIRESYIKVLKNLEIEVLVSTDCDLPVLNLFIVTQLSEEELINLLSKNLDHSTLPKNIFKLDRIPKMANGKTDRVPLEKMLI